MLQKYIEATKELEEDMKRRKEELVVSGGVLDTVEEDVNELFRNMDDGTVAMHKWITDVRDHACKSMA